jgi:hypothetical protein
MLEILSKPFEFDIGYTISTEELMIRTEIFINSVPTKSHYELVVRSNRCFQMLHPKGNSGQNDLVLECLRGTTQFEQQRYWRLLQA